MSENDTPTRPVGLPLSLHASLDPTRVHEAAEGDGHYELWFVFGQWYGGPRGTDELHFMTGLLRFMLPQPCSLHGKLLDDYTPVAAAKVEKIAAKFCADIVIPRSALRLVYALAVYVPIFEPSHGYYFKLHYLPETERQAIPAATSPYAPTPLTSVESPTVEYTLLEVIVVHGRFTGMTASRAPSMPLTVLDAILPMTRCSEHGITGLEYLSYLRRHVLAAIARFRINHPDYPPFDAEYAEAGYLHLGRGIPTAGLSHEVIIGMCDTRTRVELRDM